MTGFTLTVQGFKPATGVMQLPTLPVMEFWMHKDDLAIEGAPRSCAPCPAVWPYLDDKVVVDRQWQYFIRAANMGMTLQYVAAKFGPALAFCNRPVDDLRADWLQGKNLTRPDPDFDRVRTCSRSILTGTVIGQELVVTMMDGNRYPPLKPACAGRPGRVYPSRVEDINPDDYMYMPQTHRWLFFVANRITKDGQTAPFPNGAVYDWTGPAYGLGRDGRPYTWMPHVARREVRIPLINLVRLPEGFIPSPYNP